MPNDKRPQSRRPKTTASDLQSFVVFGDACPAICCACSNVPPFDKVGRDPRRPERVAARRQRQPRLRRWSRTMERSWRTGRPTWDRRPPASHSSAAPQHHRGAAEMRRMARRHLLSRAGGTSKRPVSSSSALMRDAEGGQCPVELLELADGVGGWRAATGASRAWYRGPSAPGGRHADGKRRERAGGVSRGVAPPGRLCGRLDVGVGGRRFRAGWRYPPRGRRRGSDG